ncbi:MAG TPA: PLP-dependent aminotransferase family protein [Deltaproteobacteria bacterium]|nr:PLP-dependent aminotransferase family protein [Deltaproteobacteria bacterium]
MRWQLALTIPEGSTPLFARIAEAVVEEIRRGRLRSGDRLPGTRRIASQLGVHRNTVVAAWRELTAQGWLVAKPGGATTVATLPPQPIPTERPIRRAGFEVEVPRAPATSPPWPPGTLVFAGGRPDLRLVPTREIARAFSMALRHTRNQLLDYGDPQGHPRMRAALATMLAAERGLVVRPDDLVITRGAQQALYLIAAALLRPGDRIAVEALGYPPAWAALRAFGAELVPIDVDAGGIRIDQIEDAIGAGGLRAVYLTPHHQYPTMVTLPAPRRLALLQLAAQHRFAILEDDYDNEFHYRGLPILPLAARDEHGVVIYVGTLSKTLAPGLRLGYVAAPGEVVHAMVSARIAVDRQGDRVSEYALATLFEDGTLARHLRKLRRIYAARQQGFASALRRHLGDRLTFEVPAGGLALWARTDVDPEAWARRARAIGVGFEAGRRMHIHQATGPWLRLGFAPLGADELEPAVQRLAQAIDP